MTTAPRVTVLMTVYNGLPYLPQAIESVLNQTFHDVEFMIIDDASTDGSVACIRRYADPRIRLFCNERNLGQAASLNAGLAFSQAPYVARMDQDDICLPDRLRQQVNLLEAQPRVASVGTRMYWLRASGRIVGVVGIPIPDFGAFVGTLLTTASPLGHSTVMYRREIIADIGGYDVSFAPCEDFELWCRLALRRHDARVIPRPLVMFRMHGQQQTVQRNTLREENVRRAHDRLVAAFCPPDQASQVSGLLQVGDVFWETCRTRQEVQALVRALDQMVEEMQTSLRLSQQEHATLKRYVYWWLGRRAFSAILARHRQSLPVYAASLRTGVGAMRYAASLAYPVCYLLSPLLLPSVRRVCVRGALWLNRIQYVVKLLFSRPSQGHVPSLSKP
ncbi:MAG: glycosyltransferase [Candidatus Omnitrophota bacterium]|nr:glycosyltransferase [Candidatus Omnitrophota bacterium]